MEIDKGWAHLRRPEQQHVFASVLHCGIVSMHKSALRSYLAPLPPT